MKISTITAANLVPFSAEQLQPLVAMLKAALVERPDKRAIITEKLAIVREAQRCDRAHRWIERA